MTNGQNTNERVVQETIHRVERWATPVARQMARSLLFHHGLSYNGTQINSTLSQLGMEKIETVADLDAVIALARPR